ncbi:MAG: hydrogenase formation protein HypD [Syntrophorhabdaceae bacterium]|nr:hydrogenase formation protein HypD [Syntrophorhabdaceae bacterium]
MKYIDEFRDPAAARALVEKIRRDAGDAPVRLMEVCGTHTTSISRNGLRSLLAGAVSLVSGPGCPVCVTPDGYLDAAIELGQKQNITLATFGDMLRVPGKSSTLEKERASGIDVRIVYSPLDAVKLAAATPDRQIVFLGVGFETTAPTIGGAVLAASERGLKNFSVLSSVRTIPETMALLAQDPEIRVQGFLCPGHVSAIIGMKPYQLLAEKCGIPCVICGFEMIDILLGIYMLLRQRNEGAARAENAYPRGVSPDGNRKAREVIEDIFEPCDTEWRGIGEIRGSGLRIRDKYAGFDAENKHGVSVVFSRTSGPCRCGDILKGKILPADCPLFSKTCTPQEPVGPCMVSSEGTCAAYYKYGGIAQ